MSAMLQCGEQCALDWGRRWFIFFTLTAMLTYRFVRPHFLPLSHHSWSPHQYNLRWLTANPNSSHNYLMGCLACRVPGSSDRHHAGTRCRYAAATITCLSSRTLVAIGRERSVNRVGKRAPHVEDKTPAWHFCSCFRCRTSFRDRC